MVYDRVDDGDKFSKKNFGLGKLRFHATSQLKVSPVLTPESEIVSVYMVYLQRMSHQFQINVISAFYSIFWLKISLVNFLNILGFLLLTSEKNGCDTSSICYFFSD